MSIAYNAIGLDAGADRRATPLASAILMPVSSLTIVGLSSGGDALVGAAGAAGMSVIVLLIAAGGLVAGGFLGAFLWAVRSGQFDDTEHAGRPRAAGRHRGRRLRCHPKDARYS